MGLFGGKSGGRRVHHDTPVVRYDGYGAPLHIAYEFRPLPDAGANSFAYETLLLPRFTPIGTGIPNQRAFNASQQGTMYALQGIYLTRVGNPGIMSGQFVSPGPLIDTSSEALEGMGMPPLPNYEIPLGAA